MKAVILVGGEGSRLMPLTMSTPKPVVPVVNRPFLGHVIAGLRRSGVTGVVLASGYIPSAIEDRVAGFGGPGFPIAYSAEDAPLGTAGAVKLAERHLDGAFIVLNGDIYADLDIEAMVAFHRSRGAKATIALTWVSNPSAFGVVEADEDGRVSRFVEKPPLHAAASHWINAGVYVLEPELLDMVPPGVPYMFERGLFPSLLKGGIPVYGYRMDGYWLDMGAPGQYLKLNRDLLLGTARSPLLDPFAADEVRAEGPTQVHESARLVGPVLMGEGCRVAKEAVVRGPVVLGSGCSVGEGAAVEDAVLWEGVEVGRGAWVSRAVLGNGTKIGEGVRVSDTALVGHMARVTIADV